ncbi:glycosyl hydrolases family 18-domain-containing protein [Polychytrium aggregatum]|uniref:glycosyl hydrolases family 18-domain-containing protein n=1 Tax=Polychytrium aggregatum TaxID=110093 RepID=UPI0022FDCF1C|nr:glycosyl hydrolases family 18-domain-containing protein [Polychytrium aggregatum]KAI9207683.1 glycosyl hydrolases family 18-domain-containing protein [Polychytrium aggregatum]
MLVSRTLLAGAGLLLASSSVSASASSAGVSNRVIGYHESWYYYDSPGNKPFDFTPTIVSKYTHINYAFATIHYHPPTDQYYIGFTDSNADYLDCVGTSCPSECIPVPQNQLCTPAGKKTASKVAMVPYIGASGACPDTTCFNPSSAPGSPRTPPCEAVLDSNIQKSGSTPVLCGNYAYLMSKVKKSAPNLRYLISVGGWYDSNLFSAATEDKYIDKLVTSIVKFVQFFGFDGVDFDWEYPGWEHGGEPVSPNAPSGTGNSENTYDCSVTKCAYPQRTNDTAKYSNLMAKNPHGENYLISIAAPAGLDKINKIDTKAVCNSVDYVNIMTYDIHGEWESTTNHQAGIYDDTPNPTAPETSVDVAVTQWLQGCPSSKVVIGIPFYGHAWSQVKDGGSHGLFQAGSPPTNADAYNYHQIITDKTLTTYWDDKAQASYAYSASESLFVSFDDPQAISAKVRYAQSKNLGGFMVWPIDGDDANDTLLTALTSNPGPVPPPPPPATSTAASSKTTTTVVKTSTVVPPPPPTTKSTKTKTTKTTTKKTKTTTKKGKTTTKKGKKTKTN